MFGRIVGALAGVTFLAVAATAQGETLLERGAYLMNGIVACGNCHTKQTPEGPMPGMELAGGFPIEEPGLFVAMPANITPDKETGIGNWTDAQIITAIREGKRPDGSIIGPPMPIGLYSKMSDGDVKAIVAYLRSVPAVKNKVPASTYKIPLPPAYGPPVTSVPETPRGDKVAYGAYLAGPAGHCIECHTPFVKGRSDFSRTGAGGMKFHGPWGVSVGANITPHAKDGIAGYTDQQIKDAITKGIRPDGSRLMPPMGIVFYRNIDDADLDALVAYLRTLKPVPTPSE
jgi:mono/diheme cytochrome c family protein